MMDRQKRLDGKVAVVTGGGRGIGRTISLGLAQEGAAVALLGRSEKALAEATEAIRSSNGRASYWVTDVTNNGDVTEAFAHVTNHLGPVDLLVNNAGVGSGGPLWLTDPEEWWRVVEVNLRGPYLCSRAVLGGMVERGCGRIINMGSNVGIRPSPNIESYATSKAALLRLTDSLAEAVAGAGISVFAISPGWVWTDMTRHAVEKMRQADPEFPGVSEADVFPPEAATELIVRLARGNADVLSGRYIHVSDDLDDLIRRADEIVQQDLYSLRLRT